MGGIDPISNSQASKVLNKYDNLLDYLSFYLFPLAIRFGMTPEQFWDDDPDYFWAYLEAHEQQQKEQFEYDNNVAFLQGQYFMMAIAQCLQFSKHPKKIYPKKPFDVSQNQTVLTPEEKFSMMEEQRKAEMRMRCALFKRKK